MDLSGDVAKRTKLEIEEIEELPCLKLIRPKLFPDSRGYFVESYNEQELASLGFSETFTQDNHSYSKCGVLRGLHAQPKMGKLISVISGEIYDVAVDIRQNLETFGKWYGVILDAKTRTHFWIPDGFLHGFYVLSEKGAHVTYKCTDMYNAETEFGINPFDPDLAINWPIGDPSKLIISDRDRSHPNLNDFFKKRF